MATIGARHDDPAFMNCILRVDSQAPRWQKTVRDVLRGTIGVRSFKMDKNGRIEVSGIVDPQHLIKKLGQAGRRAEVHWFQFGQCSDNLYLPHRDDYYGGDNTSYFPFRGGIYDHGNYQCCSSYYPQPLESYGGGRDWVPPVASRRRLHGEDRADCCCLM